MSGPRHSRPRAWPRALCWSLPGSLTHTLSFVHTHTFCPRTHFSSSKNNVFPQNTKKPRFLHTTHTLVLALDQIGHIHFFFFIVLIKLFVFSTDILEFIQHYALINGFWRKKIISIVQVIAAEKIFFPPNQICRWINLVFFRRISLIHLDHHHLSPVFLSSRVSYFFVCMILIFKKSLLLLLLLSNFWICLEFCSFVFLYYPKRRNNDDDLELFLANERKKNSIFFTFT